MIIRKDVAIMTENRIRELRKSHNMSQEALGAVINTTQQAVSKMEKDICFISTDLLSAWQSILMLPLTIFSDYPI